MSEPHPGPDVRIVRVLVVGSGFGGIAMAAELRRRGITDFAVIERANDVGGTWRDNTYPGATCDVPSQLYSLSFAPNPDWTRAFSPQPEIQRYLQRVAREHGVYDHCQFGAELTSARWMEERGRWRVETTVGAYLAQFLVTATGALSAPAEPDWASAFAGEKFHSARWDHAVDLRGQRVAVIGTGASAVQFIPRIADQVARLDVYQRTAPWVMPRNDRVLGPRERRLYRALPVTARFKRAAVYLGREAYVLFFAKWPRLAATPRRLALRHLRAQVPDPALRRRLRPRYGFGCKRVLISSDYYPTLQRENVELITDPIADVRPNGIVTADGQDRPTDVIIFATGFHVTDAPIAARVYDGRGVPLAERWAQSGMQALRGTTVPGYPNLFFIVGPNTGLGHTSMVYIIESQVAYISDAIRRLDRLGLQRLDAKSDVTIDYNDRIQAGLARSVWNTGGCRSWYLDAQGRNGTLWPDFTFRFRGATRRVDLREYNTQPAAAREPST